MSDGTPSLIQSAVDGDTGAVDAALQEGAPLDQVFDGRTALHHAAAEGQLDVLKLLLFKGADPNKKSTNYDDNGGTALHLAAEGGHTDIMEELLENRANAEAVDSKGRKATHRAAARGQKGSLEVLKKYGCDLESRDLGRATPLHHAAFNGEPSVVQWLVQVAGVNPALKDKNGRQPKDVAKRYNHTAVHKFLKDGTGTGGKKNNSTTTNALSQFGVGKMRRSMRSSSRSRERLNRDSSTPRRDSPVISSGPESLVTTVPPPEQQEHEPDVPDSMHKEVAVDLHHQQQQQPSHRSQQQSSQHSQQQPSQRSQHSQRSQPSSRGPPSQIQREEEVARSDPSSSPPETPPQSQVEIRHFDSRRRNYSQRASKGRSLKTQVEDITELKARHEEEIDYKDDEITKLKHNLGRVDQEKHELEEQVAELRYLLDRQQQQLTSSLEVQDQLQAVCAQRDEYRSKLGEATRREAELQEDVNDSKKKADSLAEREALSRQTIEALHNEIRRLSDQVLQTEEQLQQSQAAAKTAEPSEEMKIKVLDLTAEVEYLTSMLNDTGEKAIKAQEKLEKKIASMKEEEEANKRTILLMSDKLKADEDEKTKTSKQHEAEMQQLREQNTEDQLAIASLNAKIQNLNQTINDQDRKTLTYHKQQKHRIEELTAKEETQQRTISSLRLEVDSLSTKLKENQDSIAFYQSQLLEKEREYREREAASEALVAGLRQEVSELTKRLEDLQQQGSPLTQYERGGTMVALQKREAANKQTIKALENRLAALVQKMDDAEGASLLVQRQQLETINNLKKELEEARQQASSSPGSLQKEQLARVQEMTKENLSNTLIIDTLNMKVDKLSEELKKNYTNFYAWQAQQEEKDKEHQQRESSSQQTIASLKQEIERLTKGSTSSPFSQQYSWQSQQGRDSNHFPSPPPPLPKDPPPLPAAPPPVVTKVPPPTRPKTTLQQRLENNTPRPYQSKYSSGY